jgi:hypothetical protein
MVGPQMPVGQHMGESKNSTSACFGIVGSMSESGVIFSILVQSPLKYFGKKITY